MKKLFKKLAMLAIALSLVACGGSKDSSKGSSDDQTLVVGTIELSGTFSPALYTSSYDGWVVDLVYDSLFKYDVDNKLQPSIAEGEEEISEDGLKATFKLKDNVTFSTGDKLTANDVAFTLKLLADPKYDGRYGPWVQYIEGYKEYSEGTSEEFSGINVVDDTTIEFTFMEARADNLDGIKIIGIMSENTFEGYKPGDFEVVKEKVSEPIGSGPYALNKFDAKAGTSLEKREDYWGDKDSFGINRIILKAVTETTDYQELEAGKIDLLNGVIQATKVGPATSNDDLTHNAYPRAGMGYITYNAGAGATSDEAVRQALTFAFDRKSFVDSYYKCDDCVGLDNGVGAYVPTTFQNPVSSMGEVVRGDEELSGLETYDFDLEKANKILDDAGWVKGSDGIREKDGQRLEIKILGMEEHDILATIIPMWQKNWKEIGVDVKVTLVDFNTVLSKVSKDDSKDEWNVFFLANSWTTDTEGDIYSRFHSSQAIDGGDNYGRLKDAELDALLDNAARELDAEKRQEIYKEIAIKLNDLCDVVPVYGNTYFDIYNTKLNGLETSALHQWAVGISGASVK